MAITATAGTVAAIPLHAHGWNPEDGPPPATAAEMPGGPGHLEPGSRNMDLVGKVGLTDVPEGIADVAAFGKGGAPLLLFSDRDHGLYILRYDDDRRDRDDDDDDDDDRRGGRDDDD